MKKSIDVVKRIPVVHLSVCCRWVSRRGRSLGILNSGLGACVCSWLVSLAWLISWRWLLLGAWVCLSLLRIIGVIGGLCVGVLLVLASILIGLCRRYIRYLLSVVTLWVSVSSCLVGFATRWALINGLGISIIRSYIRCGVGTVWRITRSTVGRITCSVGITAMIGSVWNGSAGNSDIGRWAITGGRGGITSCIRCLILHDILRRSILACIMDRWWWLYCAEDSLILSEVVLVIRIAYYRAAGYDDAWSYYHSKAK